MKKNYVNLFVARMSPIEGKFTHMYVDLRNGGAVLSTRRINNLCYEYVGGGRTESELKSVASEYREENCMCKSKAYTRLGNFTDEMIERGFVCELKNPHYATAAPMRMYDINMIRYNTVNKSAYEKRKAKIDRLTHKIQEESRMAECKRMSEENAQCERIISEFKLVNLPKTFKKLMNGVEKHHHIKNWSKMPKGWRHYALCYLRNSSENISRFDNLSYFVQIEVRKHIDTKINEYLDSFSDTEINEYLLTN